jgi:RNA polymerase sigma-70 factor (ECF subfamily)
VRLYDLLYARNKTPVVALSRAIARARLFGPRHGIDEVLALEGKERLYTYPFYWAALGDLAMRDGDRAKAAEWLARGFASARNDPERALFRRRIRECSEPAS